MGFASGGMSPAQTLAALTSDSVKLLGDGINKYGHLAMADFRENPGTGTCVMPERINEDLYVNPCTFTLNEYVEVNFQKARLSQFRHYGHTNNNGDGTNQLQYYDAGWQDWGAPFATRATADWSEWVDLPLVVTNKIRLVCATEDSGTHSVMELQIG